LEKAFAFFEESGLSFQDLIEELQEDFRRERLLVIDGKNKTSNNLVELNTLELPSNEIRAIFAVDMLNEGWDVLNLFDIVRLYDIRDGKTTKNGFVAGNTTNAEKQLIGRGARYYPFVIDNQIEEKFTRKFDENENNELRVIEQLHYHSANNPRYISELKQVLRESGIFDDVNLEERELKLKESFKQTRTYIEGLVWMNKRLSYQEYVEQRQESLLDTSFIPSSFEVSLPTFNTRDFEAFSEDDIFATDSTNTLNFEFGKEITSNIVRAAINRNKQYTFKNLQKAFFGLSGVSAFIEMLSKVNIIVESSLSQISELTSDQKLYIAEQLLYSIEKDIVPTEERFYGSANFESVPVREVFEENILRKYTVNVNGNAEFGRSQKTKSETEIFENIDQLDWYAYDDNFGTSEEKYLVRAIRELMNDLQEKWSDIYLLRNEKAVKIYSFDEGRAFEPDFILLANDKKVGNTSWQIFIEPKGSQFLDSNNTFKNSKEGWKEKFLLQITERDEARTLLDDERYRIVGLPFFNNEMSREVVNSNLKDL
jgi:type III site-specific deoxyribonuclease